VTLTDPLGRRFRYLRLSITDVCNFRCRYCLPYGYQGGERGFLDRAEIRRLLAAFADLGVVKVRITGGEPLVRRDVAEIVADAAATPGVERVVLTTNGYRLAAALPDLRAAGLRGVNVSLDSLRPDAFEAITGDARHALVVAGIDAARAAGLDVKINVVLLRGLNDGEIGDFVAFAGESGIPVRFIELMQTGDQGDFFARHHLRADAVRSYLADHGWREVPRDAVAGPAQEYAHPEHAGRVGVIAPYDTTFCASCNRLRVTAKGGLRLCLFGRGSHDLRPLLGRDDDRGELREEILRALTAKGPAHALAHGDFGDLPHLALTGG
jgi:cyclic pyranopterin phosphate synthase